LRVGPFIIVRRYTYRGLGTGMDNDNALSMPGLSDNPADQSEKA
jgi:hypothetical protein